MLITAKWWRPDVGNHAALERRVIVREDGVERVEHIAWAGEMRGIDQDNGSWISGYDHGEEVQFSYPSWEDTPEEICVAVELRDITTGQTARGRARCVRRGEAPPVERQRQHDAELAVCREDAPVEVYEDVEAVAAASPTLRLRHERALEHYGAGRAGSCACRALHGSAPRETWLWLLLLCGVGRWRLLRR